MNRILVSLFLVQHQRLLGNVALYEYDFESENSGSGNAPSLRFPIERKTKDNGSRMRPASEGMTMSRANKKIRFNASAGSQGGDAQRIKEWAEAMTSVTTLGYRAAAGIGALATFAYLRLIKFFPSGMTPGEVLFFLFIAFAFATTYLLIIGYGAFSTLWLANGMTLLRNLLSFKDSKLPSELFPDTVPTNPRFPALAKRWRSVRLCATRARIDNIYAVPSFVQGWYMGVFSFLVFIFFVFSAIELNSAAFTELIFATAFAGFVALFFVSMRSERVSRKARRARIIGLALAPAIVLVFYAGLRPLLNMVFEGLGIYVPNASLELPESELGAIERISEHVDRPLVDCRRPSPNTIIVHGADVLWTSIGDQTVVRFSELETKQRTLFSPALKVRQAQIKFDTKSVRVLKTEPRIAPCFSLPSDLLFKTSESSLTGEAKRRLGKLAEIVTKQGTPARIIVRGHSDPRPIPTSPGVPAVDNQRLSEQRALAVANALRALFNDKTLEVTSEGAGSRELRTRCEARAKSSNYESDQCNKPNRRVEVRVEYRK